MFFVDELDGDDGFRGIVGDGFADPVAALAADVTTQTQGLTRHMRLAQ